MELYGARTKISVKRLQITTLHTHLLMLFATLTLPRHLK